jgi:hypothetical protein
MDSDLPFPYEHLICRLKRPHTNDHLTDKQKEINTAIQALAKKNAAKCFEKLQPFYKVGSLTADHFYVSSQLLVGEKFNELKNLAPEFKYEIRYLSPDAKAARPDLIEKALAPWIRLLTIAFEILENCDETLSGYLFHAGAAVNKLENVAAANAALNASKSGTKKRTLDVIELHKKIAELHSQGQRQKSIAIELSTSKSTVSRVIKNNKN